MENSLIKSFIPLLMEKNYYDLKDFISYSGLKKIKQSPAHFMYGEELELAYRINQTTKQNQVWYLIGPQIIHLGGASAVNRMDPILNEYKGFISFFKKHRPSWQLPIIRFLLKINAFLRFIIKRSPMYLTVCSKI